MIYDKVKFDKGLNAISSISLIWGIIVSIESNVNESKITEISNKINNIQKELDKLNSQL